MNATVIAPRGQLLTGVQAAKRLGMDYDRLLRLIAAKRIAHVKHDTGRLAGLYEADCDDWIERHRVGEARPAEERRRSTRYDSDAAIDALLAPHERDFEI